MVPAFHGRAATRKRCRYRSSPRSDDKSGHTAGELRPDSLRRSGRGFVGAGDCPCGCCCPRGSRSRPCRQRYRLALVISSHANATITATSVSCSSLSGSCNRPLGASSLQRSPPEGAVRAGTHHVSDRLSPGHLPVGSRGSPSVRHLYGSPHIVVGIGERSGPDAPKSHPP